MQVLYSFHEFWFWTMYPFKEADAKFCLDRQPKITGYKMLWDRFIEIVRYLVLVLLEVTFTKN